MLYEVITFGRLLRRTRPAPRALQARADALAARAGLRRAPPVRVLHGRVPPLREYTEDVPELLSHYVDKLVDAEGLRFRRFSVAAQNRLRNYPWPDNVRELKNLVRRMLLTGKSEEVTLEEIEAELGGVAGTAERNNFV